MATPKNVLDDIIHDMDDMENKNIRKKSGAKDDNSADILSAIMQQMDIKTGSPPPEDTPPKVSKKEQHRQPIIKNYRTKGPIFTSDEKKMMTKLLESNRKYEIEASLGTYRGDSFQPGLKSLYCFNQLQLFLENSSDTIRKVSYYDRVDKIEGSHVRRTTDMNDSSSVTYQKKYRYKDDSFDNKKWGIRVSKSFEEYEDNDTFDGEWEKIEEAMESWKRSDKNVSKIKSEIAVRRIRRRNSYMEKKGSSDLYGVRIDTSIVEEIHIRKDGSTYMILKYEVEIERIETNIEVDSFITAVEKILMWSQNADSAVQLMDLRERQLAVKLHNSMFETEITSKRWKSKDPYRLYGGYWNKPKNIKLKDMVESRFDPAVTIKLDGRRYSLLFTDNGTYLFNPPHDVFKVGPPNSTLHGTMLDCEQIYVGNSERFIGIEVYGFDVLFDKTIDIRQLDFYNRYSVLEKWDGNNGNKVQDIELYDMTYLRKTYYFDGSFYDRVKKAVDILYGDDDTRKTDGLILQPRHWYKNNHTFKWKPSDQLTIDFLLVPLNIDEIRSVNTEEDPEDYIGRVFWLISGDKGKDVVFNGTKRNPCRGFSVFPDNEFDGQSLSYRIVECVWNYDYEDFYPVRFRDDRDRPNNLTTARDVWEDIMNPIPLATMEGNTVQLMRKYHNQEKLSMLSQEFRKGSVILDIGSGRGGDLHKWDRLGFKKVYAVEPNKDNLAELERRREDSGIKTDVHTINHGAEKTKAIAKILGEDSQNLDGIVSFFSMTFFPQSRKLYDQFIETIDLLPEGGKFVGAVMDGFAVRDLLEEVRYKEDISAEESVEYDVPAYKIVQTSVFDDNVIGNEIEITLNDPNSMVKEQTEWLFYFEPFKTSLEKKGFKLSHQGFLDKGTMYDMLPEQSKVLSALFRTFVFQKTGKKEKKAPEKKKSAVIRSLKVDEVEKLSNPYGVDLNYIGVSSGRSGFIHSILRSISPEYYHMNQAQREKYSLKIQRTLVRKLTLDMFENLQNGSLSKKLSKPYVKEYGKKEALTMAYLEFKLKIMEGEEWVGETSLLELASRVLGIDIYILEKSKDGVSPSRRLASECGKGLYSHDKAVVLLYVNNMNYYPVAREDNGEFYYAYGTSSDFIQQLHRQVCG